MTEEPQLGDLQNAQRYTDAEIARIGREAAPFVSGSKDAGKVYCPFCKLREARWKRHLDPRNPLFVRIFVYCTQCHKTGVTTVELGRAVKGRRFWVWVVAILIVVGLALVAWLTA